MKLEIISDDTSEFFEMNDGEFTKEFSDSEYSNDENNAPVIKRRKVFDDSNVIRKNKLYCEECDLEEFLNVDELNKHIELDHETQSVINCEKCQNSYCSTNLLGAKYLGFFLLSFPQNERKIY